jgi:hypothetical protein
MPLFEHRFGCTGLKIPLPGRWQAELWLAPSGCEIPDHTHPHIQSHLMFLAGAMVWRMAGRMKRCGWRETFRVFRVPPGCIHGATTLGRFGLFLNVERWTGPKSSAARDLILT